jgi:hypothetical protein
MTPSTRPTEKRAWTVWKTAQNGVSHTAHSPVLFLADEKEKIKDENVVASTVQIYAISSECQQIGTGLGAIIGATRGKRQETIYRAP